MLLSDIPEAEREALVSASELLSTALTENYRELTMARAVNQQVVKAVARAVREHGNQGAGYDANGGNKLHINGQNHADTSHQATIRPVAFDHSV